ncbi:MAG TPA: class I SAM-dependent methyltransferase [Nocardioides sp.]|nr:class I SAM-dependent methyltransferase [Nocardioides sp.]
MTLAPSRPAAAAWPELDVVPSGLRTAVSARTARRLFEAAVARLDVTVHVEDPDRTRTLGRAGPAMTVHRPAEFFARVGRHQLIGFGEAYLTGSWDAEDLSGFLTVLAAELPALVPHSLQKLRAMVVARPPRVHRNSERNTRDNVAHHYDLSNDLFGLFLDPSLSYSSALFDTEILPTGEQLRAAAPAEGSDLHAGQLRKIDRLLDETRVGEGSRVLEIGTGWGELAIRAARRGATVRTVTLSTEQKALAQKRIAAAGMAARVTVELCDYRALRPDTGRYDAILSVEMIEAVGHQYWSTYFSKLDELLAPGGRVGIQAITMPHDRMLATRHTYTWINKYIFPGGFLPSVEAVERVTSRDTALRVSNRLSMGLHYAESLRQWDEAFRAASEQVRRLGFDPTFERMWHFYLEYARAGFASGYLDVQQFTLTRPDEQP